MHKHVYTTRIAPTPTGYLHLGNVYNFALTAAIAQKYNARILLRIDDLDHQRVNNLYVQDIFDTLEFLGIPWHDGPRNIKELEEQYSQQHRMPYYAKALQQLRDEGLVFACNCSRTGVQQAGKNGMYAATCLYKQLPFEGYNWRLNTTVPLSLAVKDITGETIKAALPDDMQYFVLNKKDGYPAYQLASVIDDLHFGVDIVVRGADLWHSTLAQHYLASTLRLASFNKILFHHHTLLASGDGKKLSKSAGSTSVQYLRKQGKTAEEIYAMVGELAGIADLRNWRDIPLPVS